ncbi:MAG: aconitase family protein, partial [bacterium]
TTCIGNSGPLDAGVSAAIESGDLTVAAVLSGNRNFEGRIHPSVRAAYLASPPLVVALALAGRVTLDLTQEPIGNDKSGQPVFLKDIWPTPAEVGAVMRQSINSAMFQKSYGDVYAGDANWRGIQVPKGDTYAWDKNSTYVKHPPYFENMPAKPAPVVDIQNARVLASFGDSITTDHISPAGSIKASGPAGKYLQAQGVKPEDFNSYGARRGNHEVMVRGTFANTRIKNKLLGGPEGGDTLHMPGNERMSIYDAAMQYRAANIPTIILAGKEYGTGSSRDWAAKGPYLLGVRAVIAESFERIHRSNLVGMGVMPLTFLAGQDRNSLGLKGDETFDVHIPSDLKPRQQIKVVATRGDGSKVEFNTLCRVDTPVEVEYYRNGGILNTVLRRMMK